MPSSDNEQAEYEPDGEDIGSDDSIEEDTKPELAQCAACGFKASRSRKSNKVSAKEQLKKHKVCNAASSLLLQSGVHTFHSRSIKAPTTMLLASMRTVRLFSKLGMITSTTSKRSMGEQGSTSVGSVKRQGGELMLRSSFQSQMSIFYSFRFLTPKKKPKGTKERNIQTKKK